MNSSSLLKTFAMHFGTLKELSKDQAESAGLELFGMSGHWYMYIRKFKTAAHLAKYGENLLIDSGNGNYMVNVPPPGI